MAVTTLWGSIDVNGKIVTGSPGFTVERSTSHQGLYTIYFDPNFTSPPAIVGSQTRLETNKENPLDGIVFPFVDGDRANVVTGDNGGNQAFRPFSFIAMGNT